MSIQKIYSRRSFINGKLQPATVCFDNGVIAAVDDHQHEDAFDAGDHVLMSGVIDAHVHINEPGRTEWEGFETATNAAAAGGSTTIVDMPLNASPVTVNVKAFEEKLSAAKNKLQVNVGYYGGLVPDNIDQLEELIRSGVIGIKCFLTHSGIDDFPNVTEADLEKAMPIIAKYNIPLLAHCEIEAACENDLAQNPTGYKSYLASRPKDWENNAIAMMIRLCRKFNCPVHIVHVASAEALPMIKAAKDEGLPLTAETCSQYIYFSAEEIPDKAVIYKCAPPIREKANNNLLKQALVNSTLDFITTDHSPATPSIKEIESGSFVKAWGGIAGIQFLLSASWTAMKDVMSLEKFIPLVTDHPAKFIKANRKGQIEVGYDADLLLWNPEEKKPLTEAEIMFRHKISPYIGRTLFGTVLRTIVGGVTVYENGEIVSKNAGKSVFR